MMDCSGTIIPSSLISEGLPVLIVTGDNLEKARRRKVER